MIVDREGEGKGGEARDSLIHMSSTSTHVSLDFSPKRRRGDRPCFLAPSMFGPVMQPRLALLASTALSATYPVTLKLIYAADGAALSPASITSLRFALMAGGAALVLSESSSPAASEPQSKPLSTPLSTPPTEPPNESAAFWRAAAELGFWACAGAQLTTADLQIGTLTLNLT